MAKIAEKEAKLAKYERERFTNVNSWKISTLKRELDEMRAEFASFELTLVRELRELLVDCVKYFEPVLQSFFASEVDVFGSQSTVIRDVSQTLRVDCEAVKDSDFGEFLEEKLAVLRGLGVVSGVPSASRLA